MRRSPPRGLPGAVLALAGLAAAPMVAQPPPEPEPEIAGAPAAFGAGAVTDERVAVPEGAALLEQPDLRSPSLATIDATSELPVVERSGPWIRVRYGALVGWVLLDGQAPGERPEAVDGEPAALRPPASSESLRERALAAAEAWAGPAPEAGRPRVGGWVLYTDLDDPPLLRYLDGVAASVAEVYRDRYGLDPGPPAGEAVLLFAREGDYREFADESSGLFGIGEGGHAGHGVAALYTGSRSRDEVASLLVHELTHLLNARTLGLRTPPWLEEGMANDLGFSEVRRDGRLAPGTVGGSQRQQFRVTIDRKSELRYSWDGAKGAVVGLFRSLEAGELPSLETLFHLSWRELVDPSGRSQLYAQSTFFVRYLLERDPEVFCGYLRGFVTGGEGDPDRLLEALGGDWAALDADFHRWFRDRVETLGLRPDQV